MSPPNSVLGGGGLHHVAVKARDWDRTLRFYREVLGAELRLAWGEAPKRAAMLDVGNGDYVEVFEDAAYQPGPNPGWIHFALRSTRVDEVTERARSWGSKVTLEPREAPIASTNGRGAIPVRISFFEGPNGELIELIRIPELG